MNAKLNDITSNELNEAIAWLDSELQRGRPGWDYQDVENYIQQKRVTVVGRGDTFSTISKRFNVSRAQLHKANPTVDSTRMPIGLKLLIPTSIVPE